jgi:cytochrome b561
MAWRNTDTEWGTVSKLFHWTMAALILGSSAFVLHVNDSTWWFKSTPLIFIKNINWHKLLGIVALVLVLARIAWRGFGRVPVTAQLTPFEERSSKWAHRALYALMIVVPVVGWLSSSAFGSPVKIPGVGSLPLIWWKDRTMLPIFYWTHFVLSWALLIVVALHAAAALFHHFHRRDGVLRAMLFTRKR